jgi:hypothetical protein
MIDGDVRQLSRQILEALVRDQGITDWRALKKAQRTAYPFDVRSGWYYSIWRQEVQRMYRILGMETRTPEGVKQHWIKGGKQ